MFIFLATSPASSALHYSFLFFFFFFAERLCFDLRQICSPQWDSLKASLVTQMVKSLPAMQETQIWSLGQEDPLEKGMATHSSTPAWRIPWTEESGGL